MNRLIVSLAIILATTSCTETEKEYYNGRKVTSFISPCKCIILGGCSISWTPRGNGLYSDKTAPENYTDFGIYTGSMKVPNRCRDK